MDSRLRTILVTSPAPVDGKSLVAANLAIAMAGAGLSVVMVDADLRRPRLHALFGLNQEPGLTDALWQDDRGRCLKSTGVEA
jgi:Mrp family chromosome partitioning ATPase